MQTDSSTDTNTAAGRGHGAITFVADDYDLGKFLSVAAGFGTRRYGYVATPNVDGLIRLRESASFREVYAQAAYVLLDSRIAALLFRLVRGVRIPVCPGSDLTAALLEQVIRPDDRVLLVGSTEEQAQAVRERFGLKRLLHHNPPMGFIRDPTAVEGCLQFIEAASPFRFCLIAVGDPQGSLVAHRLAARKRTCGLALIVGASIDFITGKRRRAPVWMQRVALEWLYRLLGDPRRLAWRYLVRGPKFFGYLRSIHVMLRRAASPIETLEIDAPELETSESGPYREVTVDAHLVSRALDINAKVARALDVSVSAEVSEKAAGR